MTDREQTFLIELRAIAKEWKNAEDNANRAATKAYEDGEGVDTESWSGAMAECYKTCRYELLNALKIYAAESNDWNEDRKRGDW